MSNIINLSDNPVYQSRQKHISPSHPNSSHKFLGVWVNNNEYQIIISDKDNNPIADYVLNRDNYKTHADFINDIYHCRTHIKRIHGIPTYD